MPLNKVLHQLPLEEHIVPLAAQVSRKKQLLLIAVAMPPVRKPGANTGWLQNLSDIVKPGVFQIQRSWKARWHFNKRAEQTTGWKG